MKQVISTVNAPAAIGPYSQAILCGNTLYLSGQISINPKSGDLEGHDVEEQAKVIMDNIGNILAAAGMTYGNIVKSTVFLCNIALTEYFDRVYSTYFKDMPPARSCVAVKDLPKRAFVEVDCIAVKDAD